eukprot:NODE_2447_length_1115_cov_5.900563_g2032_i0.p1 GENE.NODE_2447_length_1115_cov_5.900563_g2032_i0~~NODE_2447_length_1115_cov_5.900563_g2032_i0.p1  ORF type:complete len:345 (-),score=86.83 NODE_2447_length_1115_cov_5.900563_g2032_i0:79-1092(-)
MGGMKKKSTARELEDCNGAANQDIWYWTTSTCNGLTKIETCDADFDTVIAILLPPQQTCASLLAIENPEESASCNNDAPAGACPAGSSSTGSAVTRYVAPGQPISIIIVSATPEVTGKGTLKISCKPYVFCDSFTCTNGGLVANASAVTCGTDKFGPCDAATCCTANSNTGLGPCGSCPEGEEDDCVPCPDSESRQSGNLRRVVASVQNYPQCANPSCTESLRCLTCAAGGPLTDCQCLNAAGVPYVETCPTFDHCESSSSEKSLLLLLLLLLLLIPAVCCCLLLCTLCLRRKKTAAPSQFAAFDPNFGTQYSASQVPMGGPMSLYPQRPPTGTGVF